VIDSRVCSRRDGQGQIRGIRSGINDAGPDKDWIQNGIGCFKCHNYKDRRAILNAEEQDSGSLFINKTTGIVVRVSLPHDFECFSQWLYHRSFKSRRLFIDSSPCSTRTENELTYTIFAIPHKGWKGVGLPRESFNGHTLEARDGEEHAINLGDLAHVSDWLLMSTLLSSNHASVRLHTISANNYFLAGLAGDNTRSRIRRHYKGINQDGKKQRPAWIRTRYTNRVTSGVIDDREAHSQMMESGRIRGLTFRFGVTTRPCVSWRDESTRSAHEYSTMIGRMSFGSGIQVFGLDLRERPNPPDSSALYPEGSRPNGVWVNESLPYPNRARRKSKLEVGWPITDRSCRLLMSLPTLFTAASFTHLGSVELG
jgi:hypothetical protein